MAKNGLPPVFSCTSCASGALRSGSQRSASASNRSPRLLGERAKRDLLYLSASTLDRLELSHQRMSGIDFVVAISTNQHEVLQLRTRQQILQQVERCRVQPLQIVEKQGQRMLLPREYADESAKHQLEAPLSILWRNFRNRWLALR